MPFSASAVRSPFQSPKRCWREGRPKSEAFWSFTGGSCAHAGAKKISARRRANGTLRLGAQNSTRRRKPVKGASKKRIVVLVNATVKPQRIVWCRMVTPSKALALPNVGGILCLAQLAFRCRWVPRGSKTLGLFLRPSGVLRHNFDDESAE